MIDPSTLIQNSEEAGLSSTPTDETSLFPEQPSVTPHERDLSRIIKDDVKAAYKAQAQDTEDILFLIDEVQTELPKSRVLYSRLPSDVGFLRQIGPNIARAVLASPEPVILSVFGHCIEDPRETLKLTLKILSHLPHEEAMEVLNGKATLHTIFERRRKYMYPRVIDTWYGSNLDQLVTCVKNPPLWVRHSLDRVVPHSMYGADQRAQILYRAITSLPETVALDIIALFPEKDQTQAVRLVHGYMRILDGIPIGLAQKAIMGAISLEAALSRASALTADGLHIKSSSRTLSFD